MCVCVCVHACGVCACACARARARVCLYMRARACARACACLFVSVSVFVCACACVWEGWGCGLEEGVYANVRSNIYSLCARACAMRTFRGAGACVLTHELSQELSYTCTSHVPAYPPPTALLIFFKMVKKKENRNVLVFCILLTGFIFFCRLHTRHFDPISTRFPCLSLPTLESSPQKKPLPRSPPARAKRKAK